VHARDRYEGTPLTDAIRHGHTACASAIRKQGGSLASESIAEQMCHFAARGDLDGIRKLLENGAEANVSDYDGRTPLHLGASEGHVPIMKLLIEHKAAIDPVDRFGGTPLRDAHRGSKEAASAFLLQHNCSLGEMDASTKFCSHAAAGDVTAVRALIKHRCDPHTRDKNGRTAMHLAASNGHLPVVHLLLALESGRQFNGADRFGATPLDDAIREGRDVVELMLREAGCLRAAELGIDARDTSTDHIRQNLADTHRGDQRLRKKLTAALDEAGQWLHDRTTAVISLRKSITKVQKQERHGDEIEVSNRRFWRELRDFIAQIHLAQQPLIKLQRTRDKLTLLSIVQMSHELGAMTRAMELSECLQFVDKMSALAAMIDIKVPTLLADDDDDEPDSDEDELRVELQLSESLTPKAMRRAVLDAMTPGGRSRLSQRTDWQSSTFAAFEPSLENLTAALGTCGADYVLFWSYVRAEEKIWPTHDACADPSAPIQMKALCRYISFAPAAGAVGKALSTRMVFLSDDVSKLNPHELMHAPVAASQGIRSIYLVPYANGVLEFGSRQRWAKHPTFPADPSPYGADATGVRHGSTLAGGARSDEGAAARAASRIADGAAPGSPSNPFVSSMSPPATPPLDASESLYVAPAPPPPPPHVAALDAALVGRFPATHAEGADTPGAPA